MADQVSTVDDLNVLMRTLIKSALERMLDSEMEIHLGRRCFSAETQEPVAELVEAKPKTKNRGGHSRKSDNGDVRDLTLETPRDREGTFEPHLIPKHQRRL